MLEHFPSDLVPVLPIIAIVFVASLVAAWRERRQPRIHRRDRSDAP
jgi:hypothetical protein